MPYYSTLYPQTTIPSGRKVWNGTSLTLDQTKQIVLLDERDMSFRTRPPKSGASKVVPNKVAEPYTWFTSVQDLYRKNALDSGFDASVLHEDTGHPWEFERRRIVGQPWNMAWGYGSIKYEFEGGVPNYGAEGLTTGFYEPSSGLDNWAALMYGRMAPTGSQFSLSAFTGELREGLPRLLPSTTKSVLGALRGMGDDYLNVKFGWEPMLNDLRKLAQGLLEASYGLYRPFGAIRRNRRDDPFFERKTMSASNVNLFNFTQGAGYADSGTLSNVVLTNEHKRERWIEGEFVYIPKASFDPSNYMDRLETLMSLNITPSVLWQLTPWSWFVDWFTDIGDALASAEAATNDRILSTFCYAMEETQTKVRINLQNIQGWGVWYTGPPSLTTTWEFTRKRRVRANPFGYTGSPSTPDLGSDQMAILAALGLSRSKG